MVDGTMFSIVKLIYCHSYVVCILYLLVLYLMFVYGSEIYLKLRLKTYSFWFLKRACHACDYLKLSFSMYCNLYHLISPDKIIFTS